MRTVMSRTKWLRARRAAFILTSATAVLVAAAPAGAEPGFGAVRYLGAPGGSSTTDKPPFGAISCPTTTWCTAVGPNLDADNGSGAIAATVDWSSGIWGAASPVALPANVEAGNDFSPGLFSVSCWSQGNCAAVGQYGTTSGSAVEPAPMVVMDTSGTWGTAQQIALPATTDISTANASSVSCDASGDCTLVISQVLINIDPFAFTLQWYTSTETAGSGTWSAVVLGPALTDATPRSISCVDATNCTVVLVASDGASLASYSVTEAAGVWGSPVKLAPPAGKKWLVQSVSCASVGNCLAVGDDAPSILDIESAINPLATFDFEKDGTWQAAGQLPPPLLSPRTVGGGLVGVHCPSTTLCVAVGVGYLAPKAQTTVPEAYTWSAGKWSSAGLYGGPLFAGAQRATVAVYLGVSCPSVTLCHAIGAGSTGTIKTSGVSVHSFSDALVPAVALSLPGAPSGLHVVLAPSTATAMWNPPGVDGGTKVLYFRVTATSPHEPTRQCVSVALSCKLGGLAKGHAYRASVTDTTARGTSGPSPAIIFIAH
jgi:hypothetical protein